MDDDEVGYQMMWYMMQTASLVYDFVQQYAEAEEDEETQTRRSTRRDRQEALARLQRDYFDDEPVYDDTYFRRRFRMSKQLFLRIVQDLEGSNDYFTQRSDGRGKKGFAPIQKCMSAIRQLAYGTTSDMFDEYLAMSDRTSRESLQLFCQEVIRIYGRQYLRRPTRSDIDALYAHHGEVHGFPGMLGSIDCMHWEWGNCPIAWRGQYMRGDHRAPTIMLEGVVSQDLWFWHAFFGVAGTNNDINVLNQSPVFNDVLQGTAPESSFVVNGDQYKHGYYLADGIYPNIPKFVKAFIHPVAPERIRFKIAQESARKDVERGFGVLKQRWHILQQPARAWNPAKIRNVMYACIILHNMILEDEGKAICTFHANEVPQFVGNAPFQPTILQEIRNEEVFHFLREDLTTHIANTTIARLDGTGQE